MKNDKRVSTWFIAILIVATGGFFIWVGNPLIHISTIEKKLNASLIVVGICITISFFDDVIVRLWQMIISRNYFQRLNLLSGLSNSGHKSKKAIKSSRAEILNYALTYLRQNYGRRWRAKTRILLMMGDTLQADRLVPKFTSQCWVEEDGVMLIWGGALTETPDASSFDAIRKLHRRPLDGIIWVTPTFQHQDILVQSAPVVSLTVEQIDNAARHFQAVSTTLRWRIPLYFWSLYGAQFVRDDVTLHSATCLFPAGCTTALYRSQLTSLAMQMAEQGAQQVTRSIRDNFLLKMANLLVPGTEATSGSLSTLFSPHRPLPLTAVILSQYVENTSSHVAHAWMRDKRWRALLDSLPALPAELKAQHTGRSEMRVLVVSTADLILLWGVEMMVFFLANRTLVGESLDQVSLAGDADKPLAERLAALSAL